jgi:hypothetical protein
MCELTVAYEYRRTRQYLLLRMMLERQEKRQHPISCSLFYKVESSTSEFDVSQYSVEIRTCLFIVHGNKYCFLNTRRQTTIHIRNDKTLLRRRELFFVATSRFLSRHVVYCRLVHEAVVYCRHMSSTVV